MSNTFNRVHIRTDKNGLWTLYNAKTGKNIGSAYKAWKEAEAAWDKIQKLQRLNQTKGMRS